MIHGVIIKHLISHEDTRGWLAEIYRDDEDHYQPVMGYISVTHPGVARITISQIVLCLLVRVILNYIYGIGEKIVLRKVNI